MKLYIGNHLKIDIDQRMSLLPLRSRKSSPATRKGQFQVPFGRLRATSMQASVAPSMAFRRP